MRRPNQATNGWTDGWKAAFLPSCRMFTLWSVPLF